MAQFGANGRWVKHARKSGAESAGDLRNTNVIGIPHTGAHYAGVRMGDGSHVQAVSGTLYVRGGAGKPRLCVYHAGLSMKARTKRERACAQRVSEDPQGDDIFVYKV